MSAFDHESTAPPSVVPAAQTIDGPYYGHGGPSRSDIREDRKGATLELEITVLDATTGDPMPDAVVDVWHADATGHYSGYHIDPDARPPDVVPRPPELDETFLRGAQHTDAEGVVRFTTIYVGWYAARAPHVHVRVDLDDGACVLISQLFFPERVSQEVYARPEYARRATQDSTNATDIVIARSDGVEGNWVDVEPIDDGYYRGRAVLGVDRDARAVPSVPPPGFRPPLGGIPHDHPVR